MTGIDYSTLRFTAPEYLWLLAVPAVLVVFWVRRAAIRRSDVRAMMRRRRSPVRPRFAPLGGLVAWLCLLSAATLTVLAVARPVATVAVARTAGVDLIVIQDGSASMAVRDVEPDRWQRSMRFVRLLAESLQWDNRDRMAIVLFAHIAAPQVRLTTDPNTVFFFLDHLSLKSPFPLQDDASWDTNLETGVSWGLRVLEKDQELRGPSANAKAFLVISDGQAWSGEVENALAAARAGNVPIYVVGVGTPTGGLIPEGSEGPVPASRGSLSSIRGTLDRESLRVIATAGRGAYFELERQSDREIAATVIDAIRQQAGSVGVKEVVDELYGFCLLGAAGLLCLATVLFREPTDLWLQIIGAALGASALWSLAG